MCNKVDVRRCLSVRAWATSGGTCVAEKDDLSASSIACVSRSTLASRLPSLSKKTRKKRPVLQGMVIIFPVFKYFRRSDLAQPFRTPPPGFRTPRPFVVSAVPSFASQAYFWKKRRPEIRICLQDGRLHDRTVDLPPFPILFKEKLRIYMQETLSLCLGKQQETLSIYPEQIRNWNEKISQS